MGAQASQAIQQNRNFELENRNCDQKFCTDKRWERRLRNHVSMWAILFFSSFAQLTSSDGSSIALSSSLYLAKIGSSGNCNRLKLATAG